MQIRRSAVALALLLTAWGLAAQQASQKKSDSTAKKDSTAKPATSAARELFYLAVAPKDKLPPIPRSSVPPTSPKKGTSGGNTTTSSSTDTATPATPATGAVHLGIRYNLLLVDDQNQGTAVDSDRYFKKGDHVALEIEANRSGYLYVLARQSSGQWTALLPSPEMSDESNIIDPGRKVRVPSNYYFEIQDPPGAEHLVLVFSRDPQDFYDLYQSIKNQKPAAPAAPPPAQERPLRPPTSEYADAGHMNSTIAKMQQQFGTRDIAIRKVSQPLASGEPAGSVYVVNTSNKPSSSVVTELEIKHQ